MCVVVQGARRGLKVSVNHLTWVANQIWVLWKNSKWLLSHPSCPVKMLQSNPFIPIMSALLTRGTANTPTLYSQLPEERMHMPGEQVELHLPGEQVGAAHAWRAGGSCTCLENRWSRTCLENRWSYTCFENRWCSTCLENGWELQMLGE